MRDASAVCRICSRVWPQVTFKKFAGLIAEDYVHAVAPLCDSCWDKPVIESQVAEKIDEAQAGRVPAVVRQVVVTGIKSGTQVAGYRYPTHVNRNALAITDLVVTFENGAEYLYENVPTIACEAWMEASSFGTYFIQQIKNSYPWKKIK